MANVSDLLNQRVQANLLPGADVPDNNNPYNTPGYVAPAADPTDQGEVYTGTANGQPVSAAAQDQSIFADNYQFGNVPIGNKMDALATAAPTKMDSVARASAAKQQAMSPQQYFENAVGAATGKGAKSASELEMDLRSLSPLEVRKKYGNQADALIAGQSRGIGDLTQANTRGQRTATEMWDDFNVNVGQALGNTLGGVAAIPAAIISPELGTGAAGLLGDFNKFMDGEQSNRLQERKTVSEAKSSLTTRDNAADFAEKVKANAQIHLAEAGVVGEERADTRQSIRDGSAKLTRELANFGDAIMNAAEDPATLGSGISSAVGSFLGVGPVAKALKLATAGRLGTTAAIGATEAGGSYTQTANEVMGKTHEQLLETSAPYRDMIAGGTSPEDAKQSVANQSGLLAATITAPAAIAAGRLVHNFEGNLAGLGSGRKLLGNSARETGEEGLQSSTGQLAQNIAEQTLVDPNKDLGEGVGRQGGEGALYGMGMTAAIGSPSVAKDAVVGTGRAIVKAFNNRVAGIEEANQQASPVSDEAVTQAAAEAQASAPEAEAILRSTVEASDATPEVKAAANAYVDNLMTASNYDAVEAPPSLAADFEGVTTRHDAIKRAAGIIMGAEPGSPTQLRAGYYLNSLVQDYAAVVNSDQAAMEAMPADSQGANIVNQYKALMGAISSTPTVMNAIDAVMAQVEAAEAKKVDVTPESLATPEGQQDVQDVLAVAELAPDKVDLGTAEKILFQVSQGNLTVTPRQKAALDSSVALLRAVQEADKAAVASGQATKVSLNVSSVDGEKGKSVTQHAKEIMSAWKSGDRDLAADYLRDLKHFAQGHSNKVAALNAHLAAGNPKADGLHYNVFVGGEEVQSQKTIAARPHTEGGVKLAQQIGAEAKLLADVYNGLVTAFPDLKAEHLAVTPLASGMVGPVADVIARVKPAPKPAPAPVVKTEDTTPAVKTNPTPQKESTPTVDTTRITKLDDVNLNQRLNDLLDVKSKTPDQQAELDALDAEMSRREDAAQVANEQAEQPPFPARIKKLDLPAAVLKIMPATEMNDPDVAEFIERSRRVEAEEKPSDPDTWTAEQKALYESGQYEAFSKSRGYTADEIANFNRYTKLVGILDARYGDNYSGSLQNAANAEAVTKPTPAPKVEPVAKGMAGVFSHLLGTVKNQFVKSFRIPAKAKTRIFADEGPLDTISKALSNSTTFTAFVGSALKGRYDAETASAYELYLANAPEFLDGLGKRLNVYLNKPYSKKDSRTIGEILATGAEVITGQGEVFQPMRTVDGKALNLTQVVDGQVVYSPELVEATVMAALQWLLVSSDYASVVDEQDVAAQTGLDQSAITKGMVGMLSQGMSVGDVKSSLATKIRNYWGVTGDNSGAIGNIEGIPEAIAAELMAYMRDSGDLVELNFAVLENGQVVEYTKADGKPQGFKKPIDRLVPQTQKFPKELRAFPDAIEQAVMVTPEETQYIGEDARPPVAKMQLRNPLVENTAEQQQVMENNGETPYTVDTFMGAFFSALGKDNFLTLFGAGKFDKDNMNVNHVKSLDGKNQGAASAYEHMMGTFERIESVGPIGETPIRYPYNTSRVSRLQMLGKFSPQANKQVRDAILSTWSTLDLSDRAGLDFHRFSMGMAQALGIKIHNQMPETSVTEVQGLLDGALKPAVAQMQNWLKSHRDAHVTNPVYAIPASTVNELIATFEQAKVGAVTAVGLHAVMEYARYLDSKDQSAFRTSLYVEADGMTNGPFNAIGLYTPGMFTISDLRVLAKGGFFINRPGMSANEWRTGFDNEDMYTETAKKLKALVDELRGSLKNNPKVLQQMDHLLALMDLFFGKDLSFNDNGDLVILRGATKNPLTITIYGAGAAGIAGNLVSTLMESIYERMSEVSLAQINGTASNWADAMFGATSVTTEEAEAKLAKFQASMDALTNNQVKNYKDKLSLKSVPVATEEQTPITYTLTAEQLDNMQSAMLELFVTPLRGAIESTVGQSLMNTVTTLRMAVQAQSIVLEHAFKAEVEAKQAEKAATDPDWKKGDFLTQGEMTAIYQKLEHLAPRITTGTQTFYIGGGEVSDLATTFAGAFDGSYRTPGFVFGPSDAGVAGIPYLTIGPGDAQMVQNYSVDPDRATGSLPIFDGIHMPLDQMEKGSIAANKAVASSLQGNPLAAVHKTFSQFMKAADLTEMSLDQAEALTKALFTGLPKGTIAPVDAIVRRMQAIEESLNGRQQSIEARHRVLAKVTLSVDQMAAVASPYQQEGTVQLEGSEFDELVPQLNKLYEEELANIREEQLESEAIGSAIKELATLHDSGAYVLTAADLPALVKATNLPTDQATILQQVIASLAVNGYKIVFGGRAEIAQYNRISGYDVQSSAAMQNAQGYTSIDAKVVYLINPSSETLVHELIHAATFETVLNHYADPAFAKSNPQGARAVQRIEVLMEQFLAIELSQVSFDLQQAFNDATAAIRGYMGQATAQNKASALNEFMAWVLSNRALAALGKRTVANRLAQIADSVYQALKSMFFRGKRTAPEKSKDLFSNLLFNSSMLMRSQPSLTQRFSANNLFQNSIYGDNERLSTINEALNKTIGRYLETPVKAGNIDEHSSLMQGIQNGYRVAQEFMAHGFKMTAQEANTFNTIVTALSTEAAIDPNVIAGVQELYAHVMAGLSVQSFMVDPDLNDPNDYAQAAEKFDVLSGKYLVTRDLAGRSSLLPAFLALATTNDEFRAVLEKMALPKSAKNKAGTLDALLENFGNMLLGRLGQRMMGTKKATNVQQAIDLLNARMAQVIEQRDTFIETMASKPGGWVDVTNDAVVTGMTWLSAQAMKVAKATQRPAASKVEKAAGGFVAGFAALIDNDSASAVAEATMTTINKTKMWDWAHTTINDLVGRTDNNAAIYDMIKLVRSMVQRTRQQYRENLPVALAKKFSRELTKNEKASLHRSMAKTDLAALGKDALKLVADPAAAIKGLEADLSKTQHWKLIQSKAKQLAHFMNTGVVGKNLLRNPEAVARLLNENVTVGSLVDIGKLDRLITLYALESLSQEDKDTLISLAQDQAEGMEFTLAYLQGQRAEEQRKATGRAKYNAYKGYVPSIGNEGVSMLVENDTEYANLVGKSYVRVGNYEGSSLEAGLQRGYYFIPVAARATFEQGIMQNVHQTAGGVDAATGFSAAQTAGRIIDMAAVKKLQRRSAQETGPDHLVPVFSDIGAIIAYERPLDPVMMERTLGEQDLHKTIGQWRGRQVEEGFAQIYNDTLVERLHAMYERDLSQNPDNARQYVDVYTTTDPVLRDAVRLMNQETRAKVESLFGTTLMVRRDMLNDVLGYRAASLGDAWTGNSRWSPETQKAVRNIAISAFGNDAYRKFMTAEKTIQNVVGDAKVLIVVKSIVVPMANLMSNMYQLAANGVPIGTMVKAMPKKLAEVEAYTKSLLRLIEAEAELRASRGDARVERRLKTEIQAINDSHKRMTIWPLIEAGEFSGIADAGMTRNEVNLTSGRLQAYMEQAAAKLPGWGSTVGRYALITKDTALFEALQKSVEYGDFLAKSVLFDHFIGKKGMTKAQALAKITEEFVNYDRLSGRNRGALENFGLLWFYNFKIRSVKVAASLIRNNPVHALLATLAPAPEIFGSIGLPTGDNFISKLADGTLSYSIGPGQGLHSAMLNPWINLTQ